MAHFSTLPRAYSLPPLGETPTRAELVERLRLLWQLSPRRETLRKTLELVIDALGLGAERLEILGEAPRKVTDDPQNAPFRE